MNPTLVVRNYILYGSYFVTGLCIILILYDSIHELMFVICMV